MANIIVSKDFITTATGAITVQSTATGYDKLNVFNHSILKRRWRMDSAGTSDVNPVMYFDMSAAKTVVAVVLDDVNFNKVHILGHASDLTTDWTAASFTTGAVTISADAQTGRYKAYIPLTAFDYRWLAIVVPAAASAVGSYTTKWEIGRVGILDSVYTFTKNMGRNYQRGAIQEFSEMTQQNGHRARVKDGDIYWQGTLDFPYRTLTQEVDLTTLNNYDIDDPLVFYENGGDTSKVYFCLRDTNYFGTMDSTAGVKGMSIKLTELI